MTPVATTPAPAPFPAPPPINTAPERDWYVYQPDGRHIGPVSTWFLARGWLERKVPHDVFVGTVGEPQWRPLGQVTEIMEAVRTLQASTL
jgi:hypothetical protein